MTESYYLDEIILLLNSLKRYDIRERHSGHLSCSSIEEDKYGDYVKLEDVAALFKLKADTWTVENPVSEKVLP